MGKHIVIVTTAQPSSNPRMRKEADALASAGHSVHVLYAFNARWAEEADKAVLDQALWTHQRIGGSPTTANREYFLSRMMRKLHALLGRRDPAQCRGYAEYIRIIHHRRPDLLIGHNPGSLPILTRIQDELDIPVLFDAEDFHRGEFPVDSPPASTVTQLEDAHLNRLKAISAASPLIGEAYAKLYPHLKVTVINNVFDRALQPSFKSNQEERLRLIWFSQVIGLDRGLQPLLEMLEKFTAYHIELTLVGQSTDTVREELTEQARRAHCPIQFQDPLPESALFELLSHHHIGLSLEQGKTMNRRICRTNKLFVYPLAGLYTLGTDTRSQVEFFQQYPEAGSSFSSERDLVQQLSHWSEHREELEASRREAWKLAQERLNWETESDVLIRLVNELMKTPT